MKIHFLKMILLSMSIFGSYSHTFAANNHEIILQSLSNVEAYRSDEGNDFKLIKIKQGCKIQSQIYVSDHNIQTTYIFNRNGIVSAAERTYRYHYKKDFEGSLAHVTKVYLDSTVYLDPKDQDIQKELSDYKALFPSTSIQQCL